MNNFRLAIPTSIHFGSGVLANAIQAEKKYFGGNVLVVTSGKTLEKLGYLAQVVQAITNHCEGEVFVYKNISPNPKIQEIDEATAFGIANHITAVVGFGGGSAIDAAKVAAITIQSNDRVKEYLLGGKQPTSKALPIIAIPTTAGTGSELSKGAIVSYPEQLIKTGIRGEALIPKVAIVDPTFTYLSPKRLTMETGFDVLSHAVESFISKSSNFFSETLSLDAIRLSCNSLERLSKDLSDIEARNQMSYAAMIMGLNLCHVGTVLPHRLQYPIGAMTDCTHAAGLGALYLAWIKHSYACSQDKFKTIGYLISHKTCNHLEDVPNAFVDLFERAEMKVSLTSLGIRESDLETLTEKVTGDLSCDPAHVDTNIVKKILWDSL